MMKKISYNYVLVLALFVLVSCSKKEIKYQTFEVTQRNLTKKIEANGSVETLNNIGIYAPTSGRLEEIFVKEGEMVKANQKIANLSSDSRSAIVDMAASKGKAELNYWKKQLLLTPIFAPVAGKVILMRVDIGEKIAAGSIATVSTGEIIRANLDEADLPNVKLDQKVDIYFDIEPKTRLTGVVQKISQTSKLVNNVNVYQIEVSIPSEEQRKKLAFEIKIGMSVTLLFSVQEKKDAKALPVTAVNGKSSNTVTLLKEDDTKQKVKLGEIYDDWVEVIAGLEVGEKIKVPAFNVQKEKARKSPLMIKKE